MKIEKLYPELKDNIWGGRKLIKKYGKTTKNSICAESWELSFHPDGPTRLGDGTLLSESVTKAELGKNSDIFDNFPLMIKLIDAKDNLSVQVHPSDDYALANENSYGKTEMWYIVEADDGAGIYLGFKRDVTPEEVNKATKDNTLTSLMNFFPVKSGDCYFIPSGTIHAIGTGCLIYEIQQNSNITYRVYDYGRRDKNGNTRELHIEKALKVLNLSQYKGSSLEGKILGISKYFTAKRVKISNKNITIRNDPASFKCVTIADGTGFINNIPVLAGDSYFVPATEPDFILSGDMTVIIGEVRRYGIKITKYDTKVAAELFNDLGDIVFTAYGTDESEAKKVLFEKTNITANDLTL